MSPVDDCFVDTILSSASSSAVGTTTPMARKDSTLLNKVRVTRVSDMKWPDRITVSHHPPVSAFYYISPANKLAILGELRPKSKFLGNSVSTVMEGENRILLMGRPDDGGKQPGALTSRARLTSHQSM